jgi:hypothetical protein
MHVTGTLVPMDHCYLFFLKCLYMNSCVFKRVNFRFQELRTPGLSFLAHFISNLRLVNGVCGTWSNLPLALWGDLNKRLMMFCCWRKRERLLLSVSTSWYVTCSCHCSLRSPWYVTYPQISSKSTCDIFLLLQSQSVSFVILVASYPLTPPHSSNDFLFVFFLLWVSCINRKILLYWKPGHKIMYILHFI